MKLTHIETPEYDLLCSDEEIKEGDLWGFNERLNKPVSVENPLERLIGVPFIPKIIAHSPKNNSPRLEGVLLWEVEDDVDRLALNYAINSEDEFRVNNPEGDAASFIKGVVKGYTHRAESHPFDEEFIIDFEEWKSDNCWIKSLGKNSKWFNVDDSKKKLTTYQLL